MNAYTEGVFAALGIDGANIAQPHRLFSPENYLERVDSEYVKRKLSSFDVAQLLHVHPNTINRWAREGMLPGKKGGTHNRKYQGLIFQFWRFSLKDIEDFLLAYHGNKDFSNAIHYCPWTPQEQNELECWQIPEGRTLKACSNRKYRLCIQST